MLTLCSIAVGLVHVCSGTTLSGSAPVERGSRVYECTIVMGHVSTCSLPHTGLVVLPVGGGGKYVPCHVEHGIVTRCEATGFTGEAIVARP